MSVELGQPADGDRAMSADEAEENRTPEGATVPAQPSASDATSTYADSGVADDADTADAPATTGPAGAHESSASDMPENPEDSDAADAPATAHEASGAGPAADPGVPGAAEPPVLDGATGGPVANDATDAMGAPAASEEGVTPVSESGTPATPAAPAASGAGLEEAAGNLDGPLLGDVAALHADWQQIIAGFVDDPREAVADAAGLVEHTAQALVGALQARQRVLRAMWDSDRAPDDDLGTTGSSRGVHAAAGSRPAADAASDTEELRLLMQRYRTLFNDICRS